MNRPHPSWGVGGLVLTLAVSGLVLIACALTPTAGPPSVTVPTSAAVPAPSTTMPAPVGTVPAPRTVPDSPPETVRIPRIGVVSPVNQVGLNPDGTLEVPAPGPRYDQAAWYRASPTPGHSGPAVILGHVDSAAAGPSVFYRLADLRPDDRVEISLRNDTVTTFSVDRVESFPKDAFPQRAVYGNVPRPELRLITCGGTFDRSAHSYRDNTVVFAHLISAG